MMANLIEGPGATVEWETPPGFFKKLDDEFHFTLDVCATHGNAKCFRFFSEEIDGLKQEWEGICWMNPPYGRDIPTWMKKAYESSLSGATVVCLVPVRTDTRWWHKWVEGKAEVRFIRGRIRFLNSGKETERPPKFPSAIVIYRPRPSPQLEKIHEGKTV